MTNNTYYNLVEKCLNKYWNSCATDIHGGGWDKGSPSHRFVLRWVKNNYKRFKVMSFKEVYKEYLIVLRQD